MCSCAWLLFSHFSDEEIEAQKGKGNILAGVAKSENTEVSYCAKGIDSPTLINKRFYPAWGCPGSAHCFCCFLPTCLQIFTITAC